MIEEREIVTTGRWLKTAHINAEDYAEGQPIEEPAEFVAKLKNSKLLADIFTFAQSIHQLNPKFTQYHMEWDNFAAICLTSYEAWWKGLSQDSRRNVRAAEKRGVKVTIAPLDDDLVLGIKGVYDEVPVRQGFPNKHYQEDFETVKRNNSTFLGRDAFLAAEADGELIGFIQLVYVDKTARIMQIVSKMAHFDKRPASALVAKAVEISCQKGLTHFTYGKYSYGKKESSPLTEFKRRMGFQKLSYPRYYIPLTPRGKMALKLRLHLGVKNLLPSHCLAFLLKVRAKYYESKLGRPEALHSAPSTKEKKIMVEEG